MSRPGHPDAGAADSGEQHAGERLRAPDKVRAFNRYELKYLVPETMVPEVRAELEARMSLDRNGNAAGAYDVWSLYYDTQALRFYWEKIEGQKFRRKLRIRNYGDRAQVHDDSLVSVEIKQRVNRVTQKRRVRLPYRLARELCDSRIRVEHPGVDQAFLDEVLELTHRLDLRATAMTGYQREAYIGQQADVGLRVTLDHRVRGRDRDFDLGSEAQSRLIVPAHRAVLEFKANERVPYWATDMMARLGLQIVRVSKYCQSVEAHGKAPRSVFHVPLEDAAGEARLMEPPRNIPAADALSEPSHSQRSAPAI